MTTQDLAGSIAIGMGLSIILSQAFSVRLQRQKSKKH